MTNLPRAATTPAGACDKIPAMPMTEREQLEASWAAYKDRLLAEQQAFDAGWPAFMARMTADAGVAETVPPYRRPSDSTLDLDAMEEARDGWYRPGR